MFPTDKWTYLCTFWKNYINKMIYVVDKKMARNRRKKDIYHSQMLVNSLGILLLRLFYQSFMIASRVARCAPLAVLYMTQVSSSSIIHFS